MTDEIRKQINDGTAVLGIELGSTRIKAVLIGDNHMPIASGSHDWENRLEDGMWTYPLDDVWKGLQDCYAKLVGDVQEKYDVTLSRVGALGISAMMHGYLPFNAAANQIVPFRTWRNTITERSAAELTELFGFNIPQRWSIAHLDRAILNGEGHVKDIAFLTTLAGYVHWRLTGKKVLGVGEASGMFPIDSATNDYDVEKLDKFDIRCDDRGYPWKLRDILPKVLMAGEPAGFLSEEGTRLLDPTGTLQPGAPVCPPEGDAGTGMAATNSVAPRTGNVSAGTSVFLMVVLERPLEKLHMEIDMVTTPVGAPVAMVHCNTCTSEVDAWVRIFGEAASALGCEVDKAALYDLLYTKAMEADADCGGLLVFNYFSGEPITGLDEGRPFVVRKPESDMTLANFMRAQLYSTVATLRLGMNTLTDEERVGLDRLTGHGGLFKTEGVGQQIMADAVGVPVTVTETAGEGGPWGMALLAAYMVRRKDGESLEHYLSEKVFSGSAGSTISPSEEGSNGFAVFMQRYKAGLIIERAAIDTMK
jgi:sugar (pentulose or hexulose) kinase